VPEKSMSKRRRMARRKGESVAVKASDVGRTPLSPHAAKKSGRVVARAGLAARSVSTKRPPGKGRRKAAPRRPGE
jgi:hypothetical protein